MISKATHCALMGALLAVLLTGGASAQQLKVEVPGPLRLLIMIKSTLIAFNDANASGNYTVLRDLASPEFQQTNTAANLAKTFEQERERKVDISAIVLLQPKLLRPAFIDNSGLLWLVGFFSSSPSWVNFKLAFKPVAGRWRLEAIGVLTGEQQVAAAPNHNGLPSGANEPVQKRAPPGNEIVRANWPTETVKDHNAYLGFMDGDYLSYFK